MAQLRNSLPGFEHRFACVAGCAACCRRPGVVELGSHDIGRLAAKLDLTPERLNELFLTHDPTARLRFGDSSSCPFLAGNDLYGFCAVHEAKPTQCATYPFWPGIADDRARWKREAKFCPGIGNGPVIPKRLIQIEMRRAMKAGCNL